MGTVYKVLGQAASSQSSLTITTTELSAANVATITTSAAHGFVVGQQVSVILNAGVAAYDGNRTVASVPTATTFTFDSVSPAIASATVSGTVTGYSWFDLYACPAATATVVSSLVITNRGNNAGYYNIAIDTVNSGQPGVAKMIVQNDLAAARETIALTIGLITDATNKYIRVAASNADFTFSLYGSEIS